MKGKRVRKLLSVVMVCTMLAGQVVWAEESTDTDAEAVTEMQEQTAGESTDVISEKGEAETEEEVKADSEVGTKADVPKEEVVPSEKDDTMQETIEETVKGDLTVKETNVKIGGTKAIVFHQQEKVMNVQVEVENPAIGTVSEVKMSPDQKTICTIFTGKVNGSTSVNFTCKYDTGETDTFSEFVNVNDNDSEYIPESIVATSTPMYDSFRCYSPEGMTAENTIIISSDSSVCDVTELQYAEGTAAYGLVIGKKAGTAVIYTVVYYREGNSIYTTYTAHRYTVKDVTEVSPIVDRVLHTYMLGWYNDKDRNGVISREELESINRIDADSRNGQVNLSVQSLEGLEYAKNLSELYLGGNKELRNIDQLLELPALRVVDLEGTAVSVEDRWKLARIPDEYNLTKGECLAVESVSGSLGSEADVRITKGDGTVATVVTNSNGYEGWYIKAVDGGEATVTITLGTKSCEIPVKVNGFDSDPEVGADSDADIEIADYLQGVLLDSNGNLWESYPELKKADTGVVDYAANWVYSTGDDMTAAKGEENAATLISYKLDKDLSLWNGTNKLAENVLRFDGRYALTTEGTLIDIYAETPTKVEDVADWCTLRHSDIGETTIRVETYILKKDGTLWKREEVRRGGNVQSLIQVDENVTELFEYGYVKGGQPVCYADVDSYRQMVFESLKNVQEILSDESGVFGYCNLDGSVSLLVDSGNWAWVSIGNQSEFGNIVAAQKEYYWDETNDDSHVLICFLTDTGDLYCFNELTLNVTKCAENVVEFCRYKEYLARTADGKYYGRNGKLIEITEEEPLLIDSFMEYEIYRTVDGRQTLRRNGVEILSNVQKLLYSNDESAKVYVLRTDGTVWDVSGVPVKATDLSEVTCLRGDVNKDNKVNIKDLRMILHYLSGKEYLTEEQKVIADIDGDGSVDIQDLRTALRYVCGKIDEL